GVDFWHAVEFSRNGRFLRTHPLGLSSGRFPSVFRVSSLADPFSVSATRWSGLVPESSLAFALSVSGGSDSISVFPTP
ncbi:hypothetical protein ACF068_22525, partial [Streptomyces sp. NPDC016309]|uniref:hypothetical protein n=1 Tax=Streptomyces sp. NPDC016309 TaxID=3364965 RepID=UPI0036F75EFD